MLRKNRLLFPQLKFYKNGKLKRNNGKSTKINLYKINWEKVEKIKQEKHDKWLKDCWDINPATRPKFLTLPPKYIEIVDNFVFAIDEDYKREIERNAEQADIEWHIKRGFDTNVREYCLITAIKHVEVAFYLLKDCLYDENSQWYSRNDGYGVISKESMLYRFWCGQTGRGLLEKYALIDQLNARLDPFIIDQTDPDGIVRQFLNDMEIYVKEFEKHFEHTNIVECS